MAQTNPQTNPLATSQVSIVRAYEKETCTKKTVVRLRIDPIKIPPPRRLIVEITLDDGSSITAEAFLVSAYTDYAYYDLSAADARKVYPHINNIREIKVVGE